jgi:hypothetical protein
MLGYYAYRTNWHKHPLVSRFLCWIGRHDYEVSEVGSRYVLLRCFYCQQGKKSGRSHESSQ